MTRIAYRAFGLKQMSYANGRTLSLQYDNRLRLTRWDVAGVLGSDYEYRWEDTFRPTFAHSRTDATLDRWYNYDQVGRLHIGRSGSEARAAYGEQWNGQYDGPYSMGVFYDVWGNITFKEGWGGVNPQYSVSYTNNKMDQMVYDAAGNLADAGGGWTFTYDATGQQATSAMYNLQQYYDGDRLRGKKTESGVATYYLRSSVLGGQVVAEVNSSGSWPRGYVYLGGEMLAVQQNGVYWMHQDPVTKSKRVTDGSGNVVSAIELDPWGGETNRSSNEAFQPHKFTSYERDGNASDDAMHRRYNRWWGRFEQPDPYDGSYNLSDPQSFNRYAYVQNDPVNFVDPAGLVPSAGCGAENSFEDCYGSGGGSFWGGGFNMNDRHSMFRSSGQETISDDEYEHDERYHPENGPFRFHSAFELLPWFGFFGTPQSPTPTPTPQDDCHRFASLVQGIADSTNNDTEFLDQLARTFTSANNSSTREMRDNSGGPVNPPRLSFGDSGFKPRFQDGSNQVRHFVAGFIAGAKFGIPGLLFMNSREDGENADTRLNGVSTNLGSWFTGQPSSLEFRRARLAAQIREDACQ